MHALVIKSEFIEQNNKLSTKDNKICTCREKSIPMTALWCPSFMANFIMPETHQPIIVIILIIYSVYLLKDLIEL